MAKKISSTKLVTITAQMHRAGRVEEHHGDLDEHYANDRMASLIEALTYSTNDKRHNRPNPSRIPIDGDICNNLASYRDAVKRYRKFRDRVLATSNRKPPLTKLARDTLLRRLDFPARIQPAGPACHLGVNRVSAAQAVVTLNTLHIGPLVELWSSFAPKYIRLMRPP